MDCILGRIASQTTSDLYSFDRTHMSSENFTTEDIKIVTVEGVTAHRFRSRRKSDGESSNNYV